MSQTSIAAKSDSLSSKELAIIQALTEYESGRQNQRALAKATGFSLGLTNVLLTRLVKKGYVKVTTLNGRTLRYILTIKGFKEKLSRTYTYVLASIRQLNVLKERIEEFVEQRTQSQYCKIYVLGQNEFAELAYKVLSDGSRWPVDMLANAEEISAVVKDPGILLICDIDLDLVVVRRWLPSNSEIELVQLTKLLEEAIKPLPMDLSC